MREGRSSPHARGSSPPGRPPHPRYRVVPARAGIFPMVGILLLVNFSRPRTRGDLPDSFSGAVVLLESSPHARGSSLLRPAAGRGDDVVPARAGIFPSTGSRPRPRTRRPRTRGDLPRPAVCWSWARRSSPHARGSSPGLHRGGLTHGVVPARAGIFPDRDRDRGRGLGRPRTRGDLPSVASRALTSGESSPHARGSSFVCASGRYPETVVPARAGIFPQLAAHHAEQVCRPRTRGDLPSSVIGDLIRTPSSPHARGSSSVRGVRTTYP